VIYVTMRPCLSCLKESIQAGVTGITYSAHAEYDPAYEEAFRIISRNAGIVINQHVG